MKTAALICIIFVTLLGEYCASGKQSNDNVFSEVDFLLQRTSRKDLKEALHKLESLKGENKKKWEYFVKLAEANWKLGLNGRSNISYDVKKEYYMQAHEYAKKAIKMHENSPEVQKWFAITLGSIGKYMNPIQRVKHGLSFQNHILKAMEMTDTDAEVFHLYGRFCFKVLELNFLERNFISAISSDFPTFTAEEALSYFKKAEELDKEWGENNLLIAKCYINLKEYDKAAQYLKRASLSAPRSTDSDKIYDEITTLTKKYKKYL